jgi:hypothetical protein
MDIRMASWPRVEDGRWKIADRRMRMGDGRWKMGDGN